ncbi:hypothetical protein RRG08_032201 [Elysia crispata]|uniref:Uncharacterized protein n=1 Tax=Elysia crispata TaxID=231223 RepID=A0AAE1ABA0_9GAST|nr:hypothetical protein RRG08_032201 [Elysia crispata]
MLAQILSHASPFRLNLHQFEAESNITDMRDVCAIVPLDFWSYWTRGENDLNFLMNDTSVIGSRGLPIRVAHGASVHLTTRALDRLAGLVLLAAQGPTRLMHHPSTDGILCTCPLVHGLHGISPGVSVIVMI